MLLCTSDGAAQEDRPALAAVSAGHPHPWPDNLGRDCLLGPFTCCAEDGAGATSYNLLSPPLKSIFSHPVFQRNWREVSPLVFQIFCSRCSSHSAPLPRYGQMKPVRVCTHCYMFHVTPFYSDRAGIWQIKLLLCLLESYMDWYIWPKPRINLKEGPSEGT